jgi:hypothetical protein
LAFRDRPFKVLGIGGTLREGSTSLCALGASVEAGASLER